MQSGIKAQRILPSISARELNELFVSHMQVLVAAAGFLGSVFLIVTVRALGKRLLGLSTTAACAVSCLLLGLYAFVAIKPARDTGDVSYPVATWVPLALFALLSFAATVQGQLPWLLVAESFPFRYVS
jgi:hypothetical protein